LQILYGCSDGYKEISKLQPNFVQGISGFYNRRPIILLTSFTINFKYSLTLK